MVIGTIAELQRAVLSEGDHVAMPYGRAVCGRLRAVGGVVAMHLAACIRIVIYGCIHDECGLVDGGLAAFQCGSISLRGYVGGSFHIDAVAASLYIDVGRCR